MISALTGCSFSFGTSDGSTEAAVVQIPTGTYYVVVTAVDQQGRESLYSPEVKVFVTTS